MKNVLTNNIPVAVLQGFSFKSDRFCWLVDDCTIAAGQWICFSPDADEIYPDASSALARMLSTLESGFGGFLQLFGHSAAELDYDKRLQIRQQIGYIQNSGALLANRSLLENIRYPLDFRSNHQQTDLDVLNLMIIMGISPYRDYKIHDIDEIIRWRACVCRALITSPDWLLFEGIGDWSYSHGSGLVWHYLKDQVRKQGRAITFCLPKKNPYFEKWLVEAGGQVINYRLQEENK